MFSSGPRDQPRSAGALLRGASPGRAVRSPGDLLSRVSFANKWKRHRICTASLTEVWFQGLTQGMQMKAILCDTHGPRKGKEECSRSSDSLKFTRNMEKYLQRLRGVPQKCMVLERLGLCQLLSTSCQSWAFLSGDERWPLPDESQPAACWGLRLRRGPGGGHCFGSPSTESAGSDTRTPGRFFQPGWGSPDSFPPGH